MTIRAKAGVLALACALFCVPFVVAPAQADERSDLVAAKEEKQAEIAKAKEILAGVDANIREAYVQMLEMEVQVSEAAVALKDAQEALAQAEREANAVQAQLEAARGELEHIKTDIADGLKRIDSIRDSLGVVARAQYRGDTAPSTMELLVGSSSVSDFMDSYATVEAITRTQSVALTEVEQVTARNETRAARQSDVEQQIVELKKEADRLVAERTAKEREAKQRNDTVISLQASLEAKAKAFEAQSANLQAQIADKESEAARIVAQIAAIDEANRKAALARAAWASQVGSSDSFIAPMVPGATIVSEFGWRIHPIYGTLRLHKGVDFAVGCGVPQQAPGNGTVERVVYGDPGGGNYIVFNLGTQGGHSWQVWSLHFTSIVVKPGQEVTRGQVVGYTGTTGASTGCHVHQEVWMDGQPINPRMVL